jgi:hypothetical protein
MANHAPLRYYLQVKSGAGADRMFYLDETPLLIGSAPNATIQLSGAEVKPEQLLVSLYHGVVWGENLSSAGTLLNRRSLNGRARLTVGDKLKIGGVEIELNSNAERQENRRANIFFPLLIGFILAAGIFVEVTLLTPPQPPARSRYVSEVNWHGAYLEILEQTRRWEKESKLPPGFGNLFSQAWFRDCSGDIPGALARWRDLLLVMINTSIPGVTPTGTTLANAPDTDRDALLRAMNLGWHQDSLAAATTWADVQQDFSLALWYFVTQRIIALNNGEPAWRDTLRSRIN